MEASRLPAPGHSDAISRDQGKNKWKCERKRKRERRLKNHCIFLLCSQLCILNSSFNMAQPIPLEMPARDPRAELQVRLQNAPVAHAEALLSAYEVLQGLHDRGVLDLLRGTLGSSDRVLEIAVESANAPEAIRGIRNMIVLARIR